MTATTTPTYIGARVARKEDPRLITGEGTFTDDVTLPGMAYLTLVRSPHAHARIRRIVTTAAKKEPGVVAVFTGKDLEATGMLPVFITVPSMSGSKHMPIATDKARYAGDAVAAVVADSREAAKRAADLIAVDYEPLPIVVDAMKALEPGAPIVHEELGSNLVFTYPVKGGDIDKAFKDAELKISQRIVNQRLIPNAIEPRAVTAKFEAGELTLWSTTQIPHFVQRIAAFDYEMRGAYTNTTPVDAYRGAGRPEAAYLIERMVDRLADEIRMDPAEVRRKNFIAADAFPFNTISGITYDSGNYEPALDRALAMADYKGFEKRRAEAKTRGNYRGIGISSYVEICGLAPSKVNAALGVGWGGYESARIRVHATGSVQVFTGTSPHGQGHETSWAQIAADALGISPNDIEVRHGDTFESPGMGVGTFGSRSLAVGGVAVHKAAEKVREKVVQIGAHLLEASPADVVVAGGKVFVKGVPEKAKNFGDISMAAYLANNLPEGMEPGLEATVYYDPPNFTFPFGTHIAEVEIDGESGAVQIVKYSACDDCGRQINPMIVEGQLHGGIAQGIGQALYEGAVYDNDGQLLSGSMMEYHVPSAEDVPAFELDSTVTLTSTNPLGVKGIGEAGTIGSTPAAANAVIDALSPLGIKHIDMPLVSEKIWRAIRAAGEGRR